jgi:hypothetical protein
MYNVLAQLRAFDGARLCAEHQSQQPRKAAGQDNSSALTTDASAAAGPADTAALPALTAREKLIHEQGLVSVLKQIHDDLDAAVFHAYGFPPNLTDEEILERLVALNHERAEEEKRGKIRWLRPEFQCPEEPPKQPVQTEMVSEEEPEEKSENRKSKAEKFGPKLVWPKSLSEQVNAVHLALTESGPSVTADEISKKFKRANRERISEILETLAALGKARALGDGQFQI